MASSSPARPAVWRLPGLDGLELLRAERLDHDFPRHSHAHYAVGVVERGALGFWYRGERVVASGGDINLCLPDEVHTGHPAAPEGWSYRMFYFDPALLERVAADAGGRGLPYIGAGVLDDPPLARRLLELHRRLERPGASRLERETRLAEVVVALVRRHADAPLPPPRDDREPAAVARVRRHIERHHAEELPLAELSAVAGLSRYHLVRVFRDEVGVPPHAYLRQVRVGRAKALLAAGMPIAEAALVSGFVDQSHLTRWFKRLWGVTPGSYRNGVQDGSERGD